MVCLMLKPQCFLTMLLFTFISQQATIAFYHTDTVGKEQVTNLKLQDCFGKCKWPKLKCQLMVIMRPISTFHECNAAFSCRTKAFIISKCRLLPLQKCISNFPAKSIRMGEERYCKQEEKQRGGTLSPQVVSCLPCTGQRG